MMVVSKREVKTILLRKKKLSHVLVTIEGVWIGE
jgi:hypothetical protein